MLNMKERDAVVDALQAGECLLSGSSWVLAGTP